MRTSRSAAVNIISMCVRYEFYRDRDVGLRRLYRQELSVPRRVHVAHLGDALRVPRHQGRPRQARAGAGRKAVRRAGLVHQYPPRQVQGSPRARSTDQSSSISSGPTRPSCTRLMRGRIGVPEFGHDGEGAALAGRVEAARAIPRSGARRSVRPTLRAPSVRMARGKTAICCARRSNCSNEAGFVIKDGKRMTPNGEQCFGSNSCTMSPR